jgi:hypothetical protein
MVSKRELHLPGNVGWGSQFWETHDKRGNRKPAYKKPLAERKKIPRHD